MRYLLDTNTVSEPLRPTPAVGIVRRLRRHDGEAAIPAPVWHELRFGCARLPPSRRREAIERYIETVVLASFPVLDYDKEAADWHALERVRLGADGRTPPFVDGQIAAIAYVNDLTLITSNIRDFGGFRELRVQSWTWMGCEIGTSFMKRTGRDPRQPSAERQAGRSRCATGEVRFAPLAMPVPSEGERPTVYADRVGEWYAARKSDRHRREHGLFLTPVPVADFMAGRIKAGRRKLRILDPAAGAGVLCCAAVEALVPRKPDAVELVAHEVDEDLIAPLRAVLDCLADWCRARGVALAVRVEAADFILAHAGALHSRGGIRPFRSGAKDFDIVISNPPYFKIGKNDPRAAAASDVVHGQPNIYALFMAVGAALLRAGGDFVFITPRSFASGPYFRRFRTVFFDMIRPTAIHVFGSRREAFVRDEVLQENVILAGLRRNRGCPAGDGAPLVISSSRGVGDIDATVRREVPANMVLDLESGDRVLRFPIHEEDDEALALVGSWPGSLRDLGLNVSTGPVVPFRAAGLIGKEGEAPASHAPLLWMNHVRAMRTTWPLGRRKPEYIRRSGAGTLLLPNRNYVLLRRFSAKEEPRRLTAAPWLAAEFAVPEVGIENHLNYIHRPGGTLSEDEARGLAALYNSRLLDTWFRAVNGNTQVNATELRAMPHPAHGTIVALGQRVKRLADPMDGLDALVMELVLRPGLKEAAVGGR